MTPGPGASGFVEHEPPEPLAVDPKAEEQSFDAPVNETPPSLSPHAGSGTTFATSPKAQRAQQHQSYQFRIVVGLLVAMALVTAATMVFAVWASDSSWGRLSSELAFLITPIHTLVGIAVGYYFANEKKKQ